MKNIKLFITSILLIITIFYSNSATAHYGPRGLLGGSLQTGIFYNGIVYLGSKDAGVFESTNNQLVGWRLRAVGLKSGKIAALAHSGLFLYTATQDSGVYIFNGFEGSDRYWKACNIGLGNLNMLSLMATDTNTLFAGTNGSGLYKTTNKGTSWTSVNSGLLNGKQITALEKGGNRLFALVKNNGVFASDDNGATWFELNDTKTQNKTASNYFSYNSATDELLVSNQDGLFVLTSASTTGTPVYTAVSAGSPSAQINSLANNGTNWYLASEAGVYYTSASSINWTSANTGLTTTVTGIIIVAGNNLVVGTDKKGVFKTSSSAINWTTNNTGMTNINTYSLACRGDSIVATATEYGVTISKIIGNNPIITNSGLTDSLNVNDLAFSGNLLFAVTKNAGVFVSSNLGKTWTSQNGGLSNLHITRVFSANGKKYIIDSNGKLYESDLTGTTWTVSNTGLPSNVVATSMTFSDNRLFLGTYGNGVYARHMDSSTWTSFNPGLSNLKVTGITYSAGRIYAGTDGSGVFYSGAGTAFWTAASPIAIPHLNIVTLNPKNILYMTSVREYVVATYKGGIVGTYDGGQTWEPAGNQFNLPSYSAINKVDYVTSRVFLTTETNNAHSGGISELDFIDTVLDVQTDFVNASSSGQVSYHSITSNIKWKLSSSASWVTLSLDSGFWNNNLKLTVAANQGNNRSATVTLTGGSLVRTIDIQQDGIATAISSIGLNKDIAIVPNPSKGDFKIELNNIQTAGSIDIFDISGRHVSSIPVENQGNVSVENLAPGIYFVHILLGQKNFIKKVIIE